MAGETCGNKMTPSNGGQAASYDPQELLTVQRVAQLWSCSERHVYNQVYAGKLKATKVGRAMRFSRANLQACSDAAETTDL